MRRYVGTWFAKTDKSLKVRLPVRDNTTARETSHEPHVCAFFFMVLRSFRGKASPALRELSRDDDILRMCISHDEPTLKGA